MGWIGKLIGGAMGLAIGGPLGMIAGIDFENLFDRAGQFSTNQEGPDPFVQGSRLSTEQQSQMVFFVGAFSMLARMATADGRMVPEEQQKVRVPSNVNLKLESPGQAWRPSRVPCRN